MAIEIPDLHSSLTEEKRSFFAAVLERLLKLEPELQLTSLHVLQSLYFLQGNEKGNSIEQVTEKMVRSFGIRHYHCGSVRAMIIKLQGFGFTARFGKEHKARFKTTEFGNQFVNWFLALVLQRDELGLFTERCVRKPKLTVIKNN